MMPSGENMLIVMADDDEDDQMLTREAFEQCEIGNPVVFLSDGEDLLKYLRREDRYAHLAGQPMPGLVLLDLNMPRMNGYDALHSIRTDASLKLLPVIIFSTSNNVQDVKRCYELGANSYVSKPSDQDSLCDVVRSLRVFWGDAAEIPPISA